MNYEELVKSLRHCVSDEKGVTKCAGCPYYPDITGCMDRLHTDAAAAIEDLQAEMPKRGEWIVRGANRVDCSVCGHSICFAFGLSEGSLTGYNYCPNCGSLMVGENDERN